MDVVLLGLGGYMAYPEQPPSYEASQQHINASYTRSRSEEAIAHPQPPPYAALHAPANKTRFHTSTVSLPAFAHTAGTAAGASSAGASNTASNPAFHADSRLSLTGAGALYYSPSPSYVESKLEPTNQRQPQLEPTNQRQPQLESTNHRQSYVDASHENAINQNLEAQSHNSDQIPETKLPSKAARSKAKRRTKPAQAQPACDAAGSDLVEQGPGGFQNEAFSPTHEPDSAKESSV